MSDRLKIEFRDPDRNIVEALKGFSDVTIIERHNGVSVCDFKASHKDDIRTSLQPQYGIVVKFDDEIIFSGNITRKSRQRTNTENSWQLTYQSDVALLDSRLTYPCPPPFTLSMHDSQSGSAEKLLKHYVNVNAGLGAEPTRRIVGVIVANDLGRGYSDCTYNARLQPLLECLQTIANQSEAFGQPVRFNLQSNDNGELIFDIAELEDKSGSVEFSEDNANIKEEAYSLGIPKHNYMITGGTGEGTSRTFIFGGDSASISMYGRFEAFNDQKSESDIAKLGVSQAEKLLEGQAETSVTVEPKDTGSIKYGVDYRLGDKVAFVLDGQRFEHLIREVKHDFTTKGIKRELKIGSQNQTSNTYEKLFKNLKKTQLQIKSLESR